MLTIMWLLKQYLCHFCYSFVEMFAFDAHFNPQMNSIKMNQVSKTFFMLSYFFLCHFDSENVFGFWLELTQ